MDQAEFDELRGNVRPEFHKLEGKYAHKCPDCGADMWGCEVLICCENSTFIAKDKATCDYILASG